MTTHMRLGETVQPMIRSLDRWIQEVGATEPTGANYISLTITRLI